MKFKTARNKDFAQLSKSLEEIFETLLVRKRNEMQGGGVGKRSDLSAIGTLGRVLSLCLTCSVSNCVGSQVNLGSGTGDPLMQMSHEEILAQVECFEFIFQMCWI